VGGFPGAEIPDFGEPAIRQVYQETTSEVEALEVVGPSSDSVAEVVVLDGDRLAGLVPVKRGVAGLVGRRREGRARDVRHEVLGGCVESARP
jgi:hypothetical protein